MTDPIAQQIFLDRRSPAYWRVTFNHPPLNIFGPESIPELEAVVTALETDEDVKVVVFDSAVEGFFLTHYDFVAKLEDSARIPPGPTGLQALPDLLVRLSRAPVVSIVAARASAGMESGSSMSVNRICSTIAPLSSISCERSGIAVSWSSHSM